jgi:magnesium-transporting ATPase (P-type)
MNGLNTKEVGKQRDKFGLNELKGKPKPSRLTVFLKQFKDTMIIILMVAATLSGFIGDLTDTFIILIIIFLNAIVGYVQESKAEKALEALKKMSSTQSKVKREGKEQIIDSIEIVPKDIILLEAGNLVPADMIILEAHFLKIDESSLTGESVAVDKKVSGISKSEKAELNIMSRPPRPSKESIFSKGLGVHILWVGIFMAGVTLFTQWYCMKQDTEHWQTMVFTVLAFSQLANVLAVRSDHTFLYKQGFASNMPLLLSVLLTFFLQLAVIYIPILNTLFKTSPLTINELLFTILMAVIVFHAIEFEKFLKTKLFYPANR